MVPAVQVCAGQAAERGELVPYMGGQEVHEPFNARQTATVQATKSSDPLDNAQTVTFPQHGGLLEASLTGSRANTRSRSVQGSLQREVKPGWVKCVNGSMTETSLPQAEFAFPGPLRDSLVERVSTRDHVTPALSGCGEHGAQRAYRLDDEVACCGGKDDGSEEDVPGPARSESETG